MTETTVRKRARRPSQQKCRSDEDEVAAAEQAFLCSEGGCTAGYANNKHLLEHIRRKHPVACQAATTAKAATEAN